MQAWYNSVFIIPFMKKSVSYQLASRLPGALWICLDSNDASENVRLCWYGFVRGGRDVILKIVCCSYCIGSVYSVYVKLDLNLPGFAVIVQNPDLQV